MSDVRYVIRRVVVWGLITGATVAIAWLWGQGNAA